MNVRAAKRAAQPAIRGETTPSATRSRRRGSRRSGLGDPLLERDARGLVTSFRLLPLSTQLGERRSASSSKGASRVPEDAHQCPRSRISTLATTPQHTPTKPPNSSSTCPGGYEASRRRRRPLPPPARDLDLQGVRTSSKILERARLLRDSVLQISQPGFDQRRSHHHLSLPRRTSGGRGRRSGSNAVEDRQHRHVGGADVEAGGGQHGVDLAAVVGLVVEHLRHLHPARVRLRQARRAGWSRSSARPVARASPPAPRRGSPRPSRRARRAAESKSSCSHCPGGELRDSSCR